LWGENGFVEERLYDVVMGYDMEEALRFGTRAEKYDFGVGFLEHGSTCIILRNGTIKRERLGRLP
jgi:hypothetical protein